MEAGARRGWVYQSFFTPGSMCSPADLTLSSGEELGACQVARLEDGSSGSVVHIYSDAEDKMYAQQYLDPRCRDPLPGWDDSKRTFGILSVEVKRVNCITLDATDSLSPSFLKRVAFGADIPFTSRAAVNFEFDDDTACLASNSSRERHTATGSRRYSAYSEICAVNDDGKKYQRYDCSTGQPTLNYFSDSACSTVEGVPLILKSGIVCVTLTETIHSLQLVIHFPLFVRLSRADRRDGWRVVIQPLGLCS
jgi:hypothetical protein